MPDRSEKSSRRTPCPQVVYLGDLPHEDYDLGFRCLEVASPTEQMPTCRVLAAVLVIDQSNRIVRVHDTTFNRPGYVHQCFGVTRRNKTPAWHAVQLTYPDARMAIQSWQLGKDNPPLGNPMFPHVEEQAPSREEY